MANNKNPLMTRKSYREYKQAAKEGKPLDKLQKSKKEDLEKTIVINNQLREIALSPKSSENRRQIKDLDFKKLDEQIKAGHTFDMAGLADEASVLSKKAEPLACSHAEKEEVNQAEEMSQPEDLIVEGASEDMNQRVDSEPKERRGFISNIFKRDQSFKEGMSPTALARYERVNCTLNKVIVLVTLLIIVITLIALFV